MTAISRRTFGKQTLGTLATYSILETLFEHDAFADKVKPITTKWMTDLNDLCRGVQIQMLRHVEWQEKVEELFSRIEVGELLQFIEFDRLVKNAKLVDNGARRIGFKMPRVEGLPTGYVFGKQIFALKNGRSVVPHGHNNLATAFFILGGELRGRHYDRLEDADDHFVIRPTIDRRFQAGDCSTVSDYKDNVHWFQALSEPAYIFNIHVFDVSPGNALPAGRVYVNPNGEKLAGGLIRAPRISYTNAHRLFG